MKKLSLFAVVLAAACTLRGDVITFADGTVLSNCFVRDEGVKFSVWETFEDVGGTAKTYPASKVKSFKIDRGDPRWDAHPDLPDLSVTFIELHPKLPGLHRNVPYDVYGRPAIGHSADARKRGATALPEVTERTYMHPEESVKDIQFGYTPGQTITLTAHVRNVGFKTSKPFDYQWKLNGKLVKEGRCDKELKEMEEATFAFSFPWEEFPEVTFDVNAKQKEIVYWNNTHTDPLWGFSFVFITHTDRAHQWHQNRTAGGAFSFEDHYRWHIDLMNELFKESIYPAAPSGTIARVRLDNIIYTDNVRKADDNQVAPDGLVYNQGGWKWIDKEDETGEFKPPKKDWRNLTEWSLPHELGHQIGLIDWYNFDYPGCEHHVMQDCGEKVTHFMDFPVTMMHFHGPQPFSEVDAAYLNMTWNMPRGYFADHVFAIPLTNCIRVVDVNGNGVPGAKVEIFQRGVKVDKGKKPVTLPDGVTWYPVVEDGVYDHPVSKNPVATGTTDADGIMMLPNRDVKEVRTLNGFHRRPNPLGNVNVVGGRGLLMIRVTKNDRPVYFWLDNYNFNVPWFRGHKDKWTFVLKTPYGSIDSPPAPTDVAAAKTDSAHVKVKWTPPKQRERNYLDRVIGYRIYRRIGNDGLNDKPWFPVATVGPAEGEVVVDLEQYPRDHYWFSKINRFAVSSLGENGRESELAEVVLKE